MSSEHKCIKYYNLGDVRVDTYGQKPAIRPGEVLVRVEACAICGTDIKSIIYGNPRIQPPQIIGHEFSGTIDDVGKDVKEYHKGQRVTMATTVGCGSCSYCKKGRTNHCKQAKAMGFHYPGAMAPYAIIPDLAVRQHHLVDIGELDPVVATLSEPLSCTINDFSRIRDRINYALVIGLGPLGFLHAIYARNIGISHIVCVDYPGMRTELAKKIGFDVLTPDELDKSYLDMTEGEGFELVSITAPSNDVQSQAIKYARKGGYVSYFASLPLGNEFISINSRTIHYNELMMYGTSDSTVHHVHEAVRVLNQYTGSYMPIITHTYNLENFADAIDEIKKGNAIKIVLKP